MNFYFLKYLDECFMLVLEFIILKMFQNIGIQTIARERGGC